ncbi:MAG: response regulator transcription factor, partial [Candidatus Hydrogenedentes bacterium]|nr:response regulator transcription factor [Candidatus Hydrogenedentota bacterium]
AIVMDISMPGLNGVDATRLILEKDPAVCVIALSVHKDRCFVLGILNAGAKGYLLKNCAGEELVAALRSVMGGEIYLGSQVSGMVAEDYVRQIQGLGEPSLASLTHREREVLRLLALGNINKQIAEQLGVSDKTIESHRQHLQDKLGLHGIADLTRFAIREGLVSQDD